MSVENVKARLYLYAVLHLFEELAKRDAEAKEIIKKHSGVIQFKAPGDLSAQVEISPDGVVATPGTDKKPTVSLFLPSVSMLNNLFEGGFALPIPVKGLLKMGLVMKGFDPLGKRLEAYMDNVENPPGGKKGKEMVASLLMTAAIFGAAQVGNADESVKDVVKKIPDGIAHLEIKGGPSVYLKKEGTIFTAAKGKPGDYTVYLGFKDYDTAYAMFTDTLDLMAAICLGDIDLSGSLAMVEQLAVLMEKAGAYLE